MSIVAAARRRSWLLPAGITLAVAITVTPAVYVLWDQARSSAPAAPFTAAPAAEQARWDITTFPAGAIKKIGKGERSLVEKRAAAVEDVVKDVYNAELLQPQNLSKVLKQSFVPAAAESFSKAGLGVPKGASDVRSTTRRARIGVSVSGGTTAAADVTISLVGELKGKTLEITQESTLWMQRVHRHWQVVGYDVKQGPTPPKRASGSARGKGRSGRPGK